MKRMMDLVVNENIKLNSGYNLIKLTTIDKSPLPDMLPGQFVEIRVDGSKSTFLRRPISINFYDKIKNELWLLIQIVGEGTKKMCGLQKGDLMNLLLPLGNSFSMPKDVNSNLLLIGGGVGIAPLLFFGSVLKEKGYAPNFLLGARSKKDLLQLDEFAEYGEVHCTTEDGSYGEKGFVTDHSILRKTYFSTIYTCGPKPMMVAIAKYAKNNNIICEASLENLMACGFGVCLCCVENIGEENVCVCTDGPVFNTNKLKWIN